MRDGDLGREVEDHLAPLDRGRHRLLAADVAGADLDLVQDAAGYPFERSAVVPGVVADHRSHRGALLDQRLRQVAAHETPCTGDGDAPAAPVSHEAEDYPD